MMHRHHVAAVAACAIAVACSSGPRPAAAPAAIRLVDEFKPANISGGSSAPRREIPRTEWRFDQPIKDKWEAGAGVTGLAVRDGTLSGRTTTTFPLIHVQRTSGLDNHDIVHAIEIRMRVSAVSAGGQLAMTAFGGEKLDVEEMIRGGDGFWMKTPITAGTEMQTVTLTPAMHLVGRQLRHVLVRPTDQSGATFDIESVRLVFRKEHLASIASGVAWQGLKEIYRESIAARAPETATFTVRVPANAWLDLAVGTIEDDPVTFRINTTADGKPGDLLLERTITTPHRWERTPIDLAKFAGQTITLACALESATAGTLGFWGAPVIRVRTPAAAQPGGAPAASAPGRRPRGVILVQADTLRRDHLDAYGYNRDTAPALKKLAGEGTLFKNFTTQATWTKVSTPTLMTSLYPSSHGVADFFDH